METINPIGLTIREWADYTVPILEVFGNIGRLENDAQWQDWAVQLMNLPGISGSVVPDPYQFADWRQWAERLNDNLSAVVV